MINLIKNIKIYTKIYVGLLFFVIQFLHGMQEYKKSGRPSFICHQSPGIFSGIVSLGKKEKINMPGVSFEDYKKFKNIIEKKEADSIKNDFHFCNIGLRKINEKYKNNNYSSVNYPCGLNGVFVDERNEERHIELQKKNIKFLVDFFLKDCGEITLFDMSKIFIKGIKEISDFFRYKNNSKGMHLELFSSEYILDYEKYYKKCLYGDIYKLFFIFQEKIKKSNLKLEIFIPFIESIKLFDNLFDEKYTQTISSSIVNFHKPIEDYYFYILIILKKIMKNMDNVLSPEQIMLIASLSNKLDIVAMDLILRFLI